ncbi:MAG: sugar ABC transporter ATP-binding protein [Synergistaceae bacterium]|jgi:ribose transport system ATP-binding protein|nr:sugar ABC transporter ATP-binding protein [Synergistaceae bacterium]
MPVDSYAVRGLEKSFSGVRVLHGVDFEISPGRVHGLFGHNGAGKSTLLRIMAGACGYDSGELILNGRAVVLNSPRDALSSQIACVYQELRLISQLSVTQNVFLGRELSVHGIRMEREMRAHTARLLEEHDLPILPDALVRDLSHPQRQMIEIIINLDRNARYLFLDEPTTALEVRRAEELLAGVRRIAVEKQIGVAVVTHKVSEILDHCDDATVLTGGVVVYRASTPRIDKNEVVDAIVGKKLEEARIPHTPFSASAESNPRLVVKNLRTKGLRGVNLKVYPGEILGLYGLVGSGRSRFCRTLYGMEKITAGDVLFDGVSCHASSPSDAIKRGVAYLTEERKKDGFIPQMSVLKNVVLPMLSRFRRFFLLDDREADTYARSVLSRFGTQGQLSGPIQSLSGGNQQKALFGRIIAQNAELVLLDEPTKGVDIGAKQDIYEVIRGMARDGKCVVVVSTEEEELLQIADRIAVFNNGACPEETLQAGNLTVEQLRMRALSDGGARPGSSPEIWK